MKKRDSFTRGFWAGIPICLGYLSVSFTFGIMAASFGFYWWQTLLVSMLCVTSAGQLSGIQVMLSPGHYLELLISQLTINIRYSFMSIALSQKVDERFGGIWRWLLGFMMTDEVFAAAISEESVSRSFFAGLITTPYLGWSCGTLAGALLGNILPQRVMSALGIAIYAMFVAIVVPELTKCRPVILVVAIAILLSAAFSYIPILASVPSGLATSICAVLASAAGAALFPVEPEDMSV